MLVVSPGLRVRLKSALVTVTPVPDWVQVPFQPPAICCRPVGQAKFNVQPSRRLVPVLVMSTLATKPLPQLLTSVRVTLQGLDAGVPVVMVSGGEAGDSLPALSRASTLTV